LENINTNILNENNRDCPSRIFQQLMQNLEFRRLFADRIQKFCFDNGVLSPESVNDRWRLRADQIEDALIAESARWGDYRRDVHRWQAAGPFDLYKPDVYWLPRMNYMVGTYFPNRTGIFLAQLKSAGFLLSVDAPIFRINGNTIEGSIIDPDDVLTMSSAEGTIYYTTDGRDPILSKGSVITVSSSALRYSAPIILQNSIHIKARTFSNGIWSALNDRFFIIPDDYHDIKITEISYNPVDQDFIEDEDLEFLELKNTGESTLDLGGLEFVDGIKFRFPLETQFDPNKFVVLASNGNSFYNYYHFIPFGQYTGKLNNSGENIVLVNSLNDTLISFHYRNSLGWPTSPDGFGNTLVSSEFNPLGQQDRPEFWRASYYFGGSPGADDIFNPEDLQTMVFYDLVTLYAHYPNPFKEYVYIPYRIYENATVELSVFNLNGNKLVTIENNWKEAGDYVVYWKGTDQNGNLVANGLYFYRMVVKGQNKTDIITRKVLLVR
jgi:hypothetical protein